MRPGGTRRKRASRSLAFHHAVSKKTFGCSSRRRGSHPRSESPTWARIGREREDRVDLGVGEREALGARMQLEPARPRGEAALGLRDGVGAWIEATEGDEPSS